MSKQQDEDFSALIDGELTDTERNKLLDKLGTDPEARKRWHRYHLISDTLHSGLPDAIDAGFSASVMSAIEKEPAILAPQSTRKTKPLTVTPFTRKVAGMAIAATVAAVAVLSVQNNFQPEQEPQLATMPANDEFVRIAKQRQALPVAPQRVSPHKNSGAGTPAMTVSSTGQKIIPSRSVEKFSPRLRQELHRYIVNHNQRVSGGQFQGFMPHARIVVSPGRVQAQQ